MRELILLLIGLNMCLWGPAIWQRSNPADIQCPAKQVLIRWPDGMRVAYCKPTEIVWTR